MSGPNTDYDPVEVTPLQRGPGRGDARRGAGRHRRRRRPGRSSRRSGSAHAGDRSPLALANREIGALPPQARKEAGQRVGQARGAVSQALAARQAVLEAEHEERMLVEETVDVTLPVDRRPARRRGTRSPPARS